MMIYNNFLKDDPTQPQNLSLSAIKMV